MRDKPTFPESTDHEEELRSRIDGLLDKSDFDEIGKLPGFAIIERAENCKTHDCLLYVFPEYHDPDIIIKPIPVKLREEYKETSSPREGDLVLYGDFHHIGKVVEEGRIRSQWGGGHVYEHPLMAVPHFYGAPKFYRKKQ